jgi:ABC-type sugar transport system ATPase subunit
MDEPLASLHPDLSSRLRSEILRLHSQLHFTLLDVTHHPDEASEIGTRQVPVATGGAQD